MESIVNFQDLKEAARRSYYWTSFNPDERGDRDLKSQEEQCRKDIEGMSHEDAEQYAARYKQYVSSMFARHSSCASSMITGGSNFNSRRNEKANRSYHNICEEFNKWRVKAIAAIEKRAKEAEEAAKSPEQRNNDVWEMVKDTINTRSGALLYSRMETIARRGDVELIERAIDYVRSMPKHRFTERHKFFKLDVIARSVRQKMKGDSEAESIEISFDGGKIVKNFQADRVQIIFDSRPNNEMTYKLKHAAFRWSPTNNAWQRQLTVNGIWAAKKVIEVE